MDVRKTEAKNSGGQHLEVVGAGRGTNAGFIRWRPCELTNLPDESGVPALTASSRHPEFRPQFAFDPSCWAA